MGYGTISSTACGKVATALRDGVALFGDGGASAPRRDVVAHLLDPSMGRDVVQSLYIAHGTVLVAAWRHWPEGEPPQLLRLLTDPNGWLSTPWTRGRLEAALTALLPGFRRLTRETTMEAVRRVQGELRMQGVRQSLVDCRRLLIGRVKGVTVTAVGPEAPPTRFARVDPERQTHAVITATDGSTFAERVPDKLACLFGVWTADDRDALVYQTSPMGWCTSVRGAMRPLVPPDLCDMVRGAERATAKQRRHWSWHHAPVTTTKEA